MGRRMLVHSPLRMQHFVVILIWIATDASSLGVSQLTSALTISAPLTGSTSPGIDTRSMVVTEQAMCVDECESISMTSRSDTR